MNKGGEISAASPKATPSGAISPLLGLELRVVESAPKHLQMRVTTAYVSDSSAESNEESTPEKRRVFKVAFSRAKSFLGVVSGSDMETVLTYAADDSCCCKCWARRSRRSADDDRDNHFLQGIVALVDGGYNNADQTSPDRTLELVTTEKYGMTVAEWHLPREKHERPIRIDMITGAIKALLSEK